MNNIAKRSLALLMALVLCIGLLPVIELTADAATVDYVYSGNYIYNWGTREVDATFLSPNAEQFYEDNNITYDQLAALSGSSSTSSVSSSALYLKLQDLMKSNHSYETSYDDTRPLYQYTDCQNSAKTSNKISSFYSGTAIGPAWDGGDTWNREHTWPNSKGLEGRDEDDIMMLRPTSVSENSSRSNTAYGKSSGYYNPNSVSNGAYDLRGDVARIFLYVYVRWGNVNGNGEYTTWGTSGVMESKEVLLEWMAADPVDTWELGRNDSVESITGTRNVFVDYPELAFELFEAEMPTNMTTPSGKASGGNVGNVTPPADTEAPETPVTSKAPANGDKVVIYAPAYNMALSADKVTATSYYNKGVDVSGGFDGLTSAEIWVVTVNADGSYTFVSESGSKLALADSYSSLNDTGANDKWSVIAKDGAEGIYYIKNVVRGNYLEWYASKDNWSTYSTSSLSDLFELSFYIVEEGTTQPPVNTEAPEVTTEAPTVTTEAPEVVGNIWTKVDLADIKDTDTIAITMTKGTTTWALDNNNGTSSAPTAIVVTVDGNTMTSDTTEDISWNIANDSGKLTIYVAGGTAKWLYSNSANNGTRVGTNNNKTWVIDAASGYLKHEGTGRYLGVYTTNPDWRAYTNTTGNTAGQTLSFWKLGGGSTEAPEVTTEAPAPEVTTEAPTTEVTTEAPAPEVTTEAPTQAPSSTATYNMPDYAVSGEMGGGEATRQLDENVTFTISSGWFTTQARIYKTANGVIASKVPISSLVVNAGNKDSTFDVYVSEDGETWTMYQEDVAYTTAYADIPINFDTPVKYIKLDAPNAQIRIQTMTVTFAGGATEPSVPEVTTEAPVPEVTTEAPAPEVTTEAPAVTTEPSAPEAPFADGDKVVIWAPGYNKALSVTKTSHYNVGVNVTVTDGTLSGYGDTEIFTVIDNGDGTYSFSHGGQNIGLAASYTSMNLGAVNDKWELTDLGNGLYNVRNTGRGCYMEWYAQYSNWSTYAASNAATDPQFQISFYVVKEPSAPEVTTEAPEVTTEAPEVTTEAPEVTTEETTEAPVNYAAQIGDVKYLTFAKAVAAVQNGETIVMLRDARDEAPAIVSRAVWFGIDGSGFQNPVAGEGYTVRISGMPSERPFGYWYFEPVATPEITEAPEVTTVPETTVPETTAPEATTEAPEVTTEAPEVTTVPETTAPEASEPAESKPEESKPAESKPEESEPAESKPEESEPAESKPEESKPAESKPEESKPAESKPEESEPAESKPEESEPAESKPEESEPAESKPEESKPAESKPEESEPAESKPEESEPAESKPEESEPAESKPEESKPAESKPEESEPAESKPEETKPEETTKPEVTEITIKVTVPESWENPGIWAWDNSGKNAFDAWPGLALTKGDDGFWYATIPAWVENIIINGNGGSVQTADLALAQTKVDVNVTVTLAADGSVKAEMEYASPETGDATALTSMALVMLLAAAGFVTTVGSKKKYF